jgi:hypothetical protein
MTEKRKTHGSSVSNPEAKRPIEISKHIWKDNFKIDLKYVCIGRAG